MVNKIKQQDKGTTIKGSGNILCQLNIIKKFSLISSHKPWSFSFMYMVTIKIHHTSLHLNNISFIHKYN